MEHTICSEINLDTPMQLLDDVCHMKSRFGLFGDSVSFDARYLRGLCLMHHRLRNHFGRTRWYSQVKGLKWKLCLVCSEIVSILMQDRCTVCVEHTICSQINLDALDGTPKWHVSQESRFGLFGDCQFQCKIGAQFARNAPQSQKPFWTYLLVV